MIECKKCADWDAWWQLVGPAWDGELEKVFMDAVCKFRSVPRVKPDPDPCPVCGRGDSTNV